MTQLLNFFAVFVVGLILGWYLGQSQPGQGSSKQFATRAQQPPHSIIGTDASNEWNAQRFTSSLDRGQVAQTLALLQSPSLTPEQLALAEDLVISHIKQLVDTHNWTQLRQLLPDLADYFFDNPSVLQAQADIKWQDRQFSDGLQFYFAAQDASDNWQQQQQILWLIAQRIQSQLSSDVPTPQSINAPDTGWSLLNLALEKQPQYPPFALMMADQLAATGNWSDALYQLELLPYSDQFQPDIDAKIAELNTTLARLEQQNQSIPLIRRGDQYLVNVRFSDSLTLPLLIDTGASITALAPQTLAQIPGLRDTGKRTRVSTANGAVVSPVYQVDSMAIGDWTLDNVELLQVPLDSSSSFAGLLGMNFLRQFVFSIDQNQSQLWLQPR